MYQSSQYKLENKNKEANGMASLWKV